MAPCDQHLPFIRTKYADNRSGFVSRISEVMEMSGTDRVHFTSAKFDQFTPTGGRCITAHFGPYVLCWCLQSVIDAAVSGRVPLGSFVSVEDLVLSSATQLQDNLTYLTEDGIGIMPLVEKKSNGTRAWTWARPTSLWKAQFPFASQCPSIEWRTCLAFRHHRCTSVPSMVARCRVARRQFWGLP